MPTSRGSIQLMPCSAISPRCANEVVKTALSAANRKSQYSDTTKPRPAQGPLIAPRIGFGIDGK